MENDWMNLLKRMEEIKNNTMLTLKVYSDGSGTIEDNGVEITDFSCKCDLVNYVDKSEHNGKYKKFFDILLSFNKQDFSNISNRYEEIRRRAFRI